MKLFVRFCAILCLTFAASSGLAWASPAASTPEAAFAAPAPEQWEIALLTDLADSPQYAAELASAIRSAAQETGVAEEILWAVSHTESHSRHWNERGRVKRGGAGEVGLMQVKPFWAKALKREYGVSLDLYNLTDNVRAGAYILSRGGDDMGRMLGYYNTGKQVRGTRYQRKVLNYLASLEDLDPPARLASGMTVTLPAGRPQDAAVPLPGLSYSVNLNADASPEQLDAVSSAIDLRAVRALAALRIQPPTHLFRAQRDSFSRRP